MRLIDADELKKDIMSYKTMPEIRKAICEVIDNAPTVEERPHGEWLRPYEINIACECSNCRMQMPITDYFNFCPNCGADMRGGAE